MSLDTAAPLGGAAPAAPAPAPAVTLPDDGPITARQAADALIARREAAAKQPDPDPQTKPAAQRAPDGKFARAEQESAPQGEDASPADEPITGEDEGAEPAKDLPPIDPPKSWTADQKERFAALPRETQEYIAERETARDVELRRGQNEAAEQRKAADAERQAALQARQRYEDSVANVLRQLQATAAGEFGDIKSADDVRKLAEEDPFRFAKWQASQMQIAHTQREVHEAQQRQQQESIEQFNAWSSEQDKSFAAQFADFNDAEKAPKVRETVVRYLTDTVGVPNDQLPSLWKNPVFRDARMQRVVYDAARFHAAQAKAKAAVTVPKPPVQRPGTAPAKGDASSNIAALEQKFASAKGNAQIEAAAALRAAKRAAARAA